MKVGAVIVAAGSSTRMGGIDKLLQSVAGQPLVSYAIRAFDSHSRIDELVVVASAANIDAIRKIGAGFSKVRVVPGGPRRRDSVLNGLDALMSPDVVVVHDGARPLVTQTLIDVAVDGAMDVGAAVCAVPVLDTVKQAGNDRLVSATVPREGLWLAQTPQAFKTDLLRQAHEARDIEATDDAALVELLGEPVRLVMGSRENLKVTTPDDLALVEALLSAGSRRYTEA